MVLSIIIFPFISRFPAVFWYRYRNRENPYILVFPKDLVVIL